MEKDDGFWLNVSYVGFAGVMYYIFFKMIETVGIQTTWAERYDAWWTPTDHLAALALGVAAAFYLKMNKERHEYFLQSISELRKVTWPSFEDTRRMTIIVCVVVAFFAGILAVFDMAWSFVLKQIIALA